MTLQTVDLESLVKNLKANDKAIVERQLTNGFEICRHRTESFDAVLLQLLNNLIETPQPKYNFVIGAVGGYGRGQLRPNSDLDIILIYEDGVPDDDPFLISYTKGLSEFLSKTLGIGDSPIINKLSDIDAPDKFDTKKFSACLDYRRLRGSEEFEANFIRELKGSMDKLGFFLDMKATLEGLEKEQPYGIDNIPFNIKYSTGGLRQFNATVHVQGSEKFEPSSAVYKRMPGDVIEAYATLLKASSWLNLRYGLNAEKLKRKARAGIPDNDVFRISDLEEFERYFGNGSLQTLHQSRRTIKQFSEKVFYELLKGGIRSSIFIFGLNGLGLHSYHQDGDRCEAFYGLLIEAQKRNLKIDPLAYHNLIAEASKFADYRPEFLDFFHQKGDLAGTLETLLSSGVLGFVLPGFSSLETSYFEDMHRNRDITRARQAINRISNLDSLIHAEYSQSHQKRFFSKEYSLFDSNQKVPLKLALLCKAIPQTLGITTKQYLGDLKKSYPGLAEDSLIMIGFLIDNKNLLFGTAQTELLMEGSTIDSVVGKIRNQERLRSLLLFTYADLDGIHGSGKQFLKSKYYSNSDWDNLIFLYKKIMDRLNGTEKADYNPEELDDKTAEIAKHVPLSFFRSRHKDPFSINLKYIHDVHANKEPTVILEQKSEDYFLLKIIAEDFPGLLWRVAGVCYKHKANIQQAEIYSIAGQYNIALDFFEINAQMMNGIQSFKDNLISVVKEGKDVDIDAQLLLRKMNVGYALEYFPNVEKFRMSIEAKDQKGLLYAVSRTLSENVGVNICTTKAYTLRNGRIKDILFFASEKPIQDVGELIAKNFNI